MSQKNIATSPATLWRVAITKLKVELSPTKSDSDSGCSWEIYSFNFSSLGKQKKLFTFVFLSSPRARDEGSEKVASTSFVAAKKLFRLIETWNVFTCKCERKNICEHVSRFDDLGRWGGWQKYAPTFFSLRLLLFSWQAEKWGGKFYARNQKPRRDKLCF